MAHNNTPTCHDSHSVNENFEKKTFLQRTHLFLGESSFCAKETACILRQDMTNVSRLIWSETWKKRNAPRSSFWVDPEVCLCWVFSQSWMTLKWRYSISLSGLFHLILTTTTFKWARWWVAGKGKIEKIYFYFPPRRLIRYTGWSDRLGLRHRASVSLFWDFWCPYRLLCHPKTGSKFPVGQIHSLMGFTVSQIGDCLKEEFQDLVIFAQCTGCLISKISPSCMEYLWHKLYQFKFS